MSQTLKPFPSLNNVVLKFLSQIENPLAIPLKGGKIRLEVALNMKPVNINCGTVKPKHKMSATVTVTAKRTGNRHFVATFTADELMDIHGESKVMVFEKDEEGRN